MLIFPLRKNREKYYLYKFHLNKNVLRIKRFLMTQNKIWEGKKLTCKISLGWVLIAALVNCFSIFGSSGGILICWEQYIGSSFPIFSETTFLFYYFYYICYRNSKFKHNHFSFIVTRLEIQRDRRQILLLVLIQFILINWLLSLLKSSKNPNFSYIFSRYRIS